MPRRTPFQHHQPAESPHKISAVRSDEADPTRSDSLTLCRRSHRRKSIELQLCNQVELPSNLQHPYADLSCDDRSAKRILDIAAIITAIALRRTTYEPRHLFTKES